MSWNRYAYVAGDPVNFNDPKGLLNCWVSGWRNGDAFVTCQGDYGQPGPLAGPIVYEGVGAATVANEQFLVVLAQEQLASGDTPGGLRNAREGLRQISQMDLSKCAGLLTGMTGKSMAQIQETARMSAGFVYDGTTALVLWSAGQFGEERTSGHTVADEFNNDEGLNALSQISGYAICLRPERFTEIAGGNRFSLKTGALTSTGYGTLLHEILHKFGVTHDKMMGALGVDPFQAAAERAAVFSRRLGEECFD